MNPANASHMNPADTSQQTPAPRSITRTIILTGLLAGTLDGLSACVYYYAFSGSTHVENVFKFVASGALGKSALTGGTGVVIAGILFHYFFAFSFTIIFFLAYPKLPILAKNKYITAISYGLVVWCMMNLIVVPLSGTPKLPFHFSRALINALILMFAIGLPNSLIANATYGRHEQPTS